MRKHFLTLCVAIALSHLNTLGTNTKIFGTFNTISEMEKYAAILDELPQPDLPDWENPDYTSYYKTIHQTIASKLLSTTGIARYAWTPTIFSNSLKKVVMMREYAGFNGRFVQKISPPPGTRIIIFGEINGALHSLIRDLRSLQKQSLINEHLFIEQPDCYIVFNGNACSRSPYALETLTIILELMLKNPDRVIYTRGSQEDKERWMNYSLKRDLVNRAYKLDKSIVPLQDLVNKFFNTLPLAFYIIGSSSKKNIEIIRISNYGTEIKDKELQEKEFSDFFTQPNVSIGYVNPEARKKGSMEVKMRAIIRGEQFFRSQYLPSQGLQMSGKEEGATGWTIMSSPNLASQMLFKFFHDAYAIITTHQSFDDWTITLYNRNIKDNEDIKASKYYKLLSGTEIPLMNELKERKKNLEKKIEFLENNISSIDQSFKTIKIDQIKNEIASIQNKRRIPEKAGLHKEKTTHPSKMYTPEIVVTQNEALTEKQTPYKNNSILFGSTMDFSRATKSLSVAVKNGVELALSTLKGGLPIQFIALDDTYDPAKARENIERLIKEYKATFFLNPVGSANFDSFKDLIQIGSLAVLFPLPGITYKRTPENALKYCVYYRPSYEDEGNILTEYIINTINPKKIAVFYQNDLFGKACLAGITATTHKHIKILKISYERNDADFTKQISILQKESPDCIILCAVPASAAALLQQLPDSLLNKNKFFGISDLGEAGFQRIAKDKRINCITTNVVPDPSNMQIPLIAEYNRLTSQAHIPANTWALEAFLTTKLTLDIIKSLSEITKDTIINTLEEIKNRDFYGINLNFNSQTRQLSHTLWIDEGTGPWKEINILKTPPHIGGPANLKPSKRKTISVGCTADLTRNASVFSKPVIVGVESIFNATNASGGINGTTINLYVKNDEYLPEKARTNILSFIDEKIDTIILPVGSPTLNAYLDLVKNKKILVLFPITGAETFRSKDLQYIIHARASYTQEGERLAQYALETLKAKKIALFYQQDIEVIDSVKNYFQKKDFKDFIDLSYTRQTVNFTQQVEAITQFDPDTIIFFAIPAAAFELIRQIGIPNLGGKNLLGWSDLISEAFTKGIRQRGLKILTSSVVPNPTLSTLPIVQEYRNYARAQNFPLDCFSLEGFIGGKIFEEIIKKINGPITKEKIIAVAEQFNNFDLSGITLTFNPETRQLINSIWFDIGTEEWLEEKFQVKPLTAQDMSSEQKKVSLPMKPDLQEADDITDSTSIVIGSTLDLSRMNKILGIHIKEGTELALTDTITHNKNIQFIALDDENQPEKARANVLKLINEYSCQFLINAPFSQGFYEYIDLIKAGTIAALFPLEGNPFKRDATSAMKYCVYFRGSWGDEAYYLTQRYIQKYHPQKMAVFYQKDLFGKGIIEGIQRATQGTTQFITIPFKRNDMNFEEQIHIIKKEKPECLLLATPMLAAMYLLRQLPDQIIKTIKLFSGSSMSTPAFKNFCQEKQINVTIINHVEDPNTSNTLIAQEFRERAKKHGITVNAINFESYITASLLLDIFNNITGPITKDSVISALENIKDKDFKGIKLNFDPVTRQLSNSLWIDEGTGKPWEKVTIDSEIEKESSQNQRSKSRV